MKKKKVTAIVLTACLAAVAMIGATLAYFTSATEDVVNTFTVGNVDISLTEPSFNPDEAKDLQPGAAVKKDPRVTNTGAGDGYIVLQVTGMDAMSAQQFAAVYDAEKWDLVDADGNKLAVPEGNKLVDGYYVYKEGALVAGATTAPLFTEVKLSEEATEVTSAEYKIIGNFKDENGLFTYKNAEGVVIEENIGRQPTVLDKDGNPIVFYTINGVEVTEGTTFTTADAAKEYVMEHYKEASSFVFNLTVKGYAIQADNIAFTTDGSYTWVSELVK